MSEQGKFIAYAPCWSCGRSFTFDPDLVPSIPIDPDRKAPLDVDSDGSPRRWTTDEYQRSVKQPVCEVCVTAANANRKAEGRPPIDVLPGAYLH